jgi:hypothetical protein
MRSIEVEPKFGSAFKTKTEITNFPKSPKEYFVFKSSPETQIARGALLSFSFLGILYGGYGIKILSFLGIQIEDGNEHISTAVFFFIIIELIIFLLLYYRDLQHHKLCGNQKKLENIKIIEDDLLKIKELKKLKLLVYLQKKFSETLTQDEVQKDLTTKLKKNLLDDFIIDFNQSIDDFKDHDLKMINQIKLDCKKADINVAATISWKIRIIDAAVHNILHYKKEIAEKEQYNNELSLEKFNKNIIYIGVEGIYPFVLGILGAIFLWDDTEIGYIFFELLKIIGGRGVLILFLCVILFIMRIRAVLHTNQK